MNLKRNDGGFTLVELLVTITIIIVLAAMGLYVYYGVFGKAYVGGITNNIEQLENAAQLYAESNGGSFAGISAATMQADGDLPPNWSIASDGGAVPPNTSVVSEYYVFAALMPGDSFDIGFFGSSLTDNEVRSICIAFENKIVGFRWNTANYSVSTGGTNCNAIPADNNVIEATFWLGFE